MAQGGEFMTTVANILKFIESLAPVSMKMDWDNVGLLCGRAENNVSKILVALDPFEDVCQEAIEIGAQCIVTHHPLIFQPMKNITGETSIGRTVLSMAAHSISAINAHTNLDCAPGGVNDCLAQMLHLENTQVISPSGVDQLGRPWGLLRQGIIKEQPLHVFLAHVKSTLGCPGLRYVDGGKPVHHVAVGGGSCGSELIDAYDAGCDTFVTADVKYNQFWDAHDLGMNLIDAGHFYTENPVCSYLAASLAAKYPEISVVISKKHRDCMNFF